MTGIPSVVAQTTLLKSYARRDAAAAWRVFAGMGHRDGFAWKAFIDAFAASGQFDQAGKLLAKMPMVNVVTQTVAVTVLAKTGRLDSARSVFDKMQQRDVQAWTAMLTAYYQAGQLGRARETYEKMPQWDPFAATAMISVLGSTVGGGDGGVEEAAALFESMPTKTDITWSSLLGVFVCNARLLQAEATFHRMPQRDVVAWTMMIGAYAPNSYLERLSGSRGEKGPPVKVDVAAAKRMFDGIPQPNMVSYNAMLAAFSLNGHLLKAEETLRRMPQINVLSFNALLTGYSLAGLMDEAFACFDSIPDRDTVCWNAMLAAFAKNGHNLECFELFSAMNVDGGAVANDVTFTTVLNGCSHAGLLFKARGYFLMMVGDHGVVPILEHYYCLLDLLGRCKQFERAEELTETMPIVPNPATCITLLAAHHRGSGGAAVEVGSAELGRDPSLYVLASLTALPWA